MAELTRTHNIEEIIAAPIGTAATLMGWVARRRDLGQLIFITLRDRWGELQCTLDPEESPESHAVASECRGEFVVAFTGVTRARPEKEQREGPGGDREFIVQSAEILSRAETTPFVIEEEVKASEELRLKHRYIDLRRRTMVRNIAIRHQVVRIIRDYLSELGFLEIETPLLANTTPEGARDYVVPSRVHPGQFYALPQSPQLFKQVLMCSGMDRYFQIAKCLRDEDLRGNRQPEHTQLDLEMSFTTREELFTMGEGYMKRIWAECIGEELPVPFPRVPYNEAIERWGSDKPDARFGSEIREVTALWQGTEAAFVTAGLEEGGVVHGIFIPGLSLSRKELDNWTDVAKKLGANGLMTVETGGDEPKGSVAKFAPDIAAFAKLATEAEGTNAGTWCMVLGPKAKNLKVLGELRLRLGDAQGLIDRSKWAPMWVVDFPLYEINDETGGVTAAHHAFTNPLAADMHKLDSTDIDELLSIRADNYDMVLNGVEMASGSLRVFDPALQMRILRNMGLSDEQIEHRFGWFLEAYRYGAPPHRGYGQGIDRLVMSLLQVDNIREVIAFPKTASAQCPLTGAPATIEQEQWWELRLQPLK
ncbi:MAG: aspartate--tRNA ligase [Planctomycetales bacterium]|nr:aspartate--tRNA ligase [bacterium]UNM08665.1 MAG: aspartate--tRNA ligase [Planctomycetales bacterium]